MTMNDSDRNLVAQALAWAADQYVEFGKQADAMENGERLAQQWRTQAIQARKWAILLGDDLATVNITGPGDVHVRELRAHEEARQITAQAVIDARRAS